MIPAEAAEQHGWQAILELVYAHRDGQSLLTERRHRGPLRVQKPLYPEGDGTCHTIVVHPPGGIADGDRLELDVSLCDSTRVLMTTPGATKWYRATAAGARQDLRYEIQPGAILEWLPQESIVFDGARAEMTTSVRLHGDARYLGWEILCLGRQAAGERFSRGRVRLRTEIWREGARLWNEFALVHGADGQLESPSGCAGHPVCATMLLAGTDIDAELLTRLREVTVGDGIRGGITTLPGMLVARCLAPYAEPARHYFMALWSLLRPAVSGRPAIAPRIWST
jgi:urease accessory protein